MLEKDDSYKWEEIFQNKTFISSLSGINKKYDQNITTNIRWSDSKNTLFSEKSKAFLEIRALKKG